MSLLILNLYQCYAEDFGHYLAGLIEGDGCFSRYTVFIVFNILDASLAYYIKGRLGYGTVSKIKSMNQLDLPIQKKYQIYRLNIRYSPNKSVSSWVLI